MGDNKRKDKESVYQWKNRIYRQNRNIEELEPATVVADRTDYHNEDRKKIARLALRRRINDMYDKTRSITINDTLPKPPTNYELKLRLADLQQFPSDTMWTPHVRTPESETAKKGHPLVNGLKGIVLHHTGNDPLDEVQKLFMDPKSATEASAHVVIDRNGNRTVFAEPEQVTNHAGYSAHNVDGVVKDNANDYMLGVEFIGNTNTEPLTTEQINSFIDYAAPIIQKYNIPFEDIVTHQMVSDTYDRYAKPNAVGPRKIDIDPSQYKRIQELLQQYVYTPKQ